jgi:integrase
MGVKVRFVEERWVKRNGTAEKEKLETPYWAVFVDYRGKRKFIKAEGKREAQALAREIESGLIQEEWTNTEDNLGAELFGEYAARWLGGKKGTRKYGTGASYTGNLSNHLLPRFGEKSLRDISRADVRQLCTEKLAEGYSVETVKVMVAVLRAILGQAVEDGILPVNVASRPGKFVPKVSRKKRKVFKPEPTEMVLKVAREMDPDIYPALLLGCRAGLRIGEICGLSWEDLDFDAGTLTVRRTSNKGHLGTPKGGQERVIPLSPELDEALRGYRARRAKSVLRTGNRWLYSLSSGKPVYDGWIRDRFRKCVEAAGFPSTGEFHTLRHSFASHLFDMGAPATDVRDLLGHAELTTTNIYAHPVSDAKAIVRQLDRLGKSANPRKQEGIESRDVLLN